MPQIDNDCYEMIYPKNSHPVMPEKDMPEDAKSDFNEARQVYGLSPRAAAALLRLSLQRICKAIGYEGQNINADIRKMAADGRLPSSVIKVADIVRITGNASVHPGEMDSQDLDFVALKLFDLVNLIVRKAITEPNEIEELYKLTPEGPRVAAELADSKYQAAKLRLSP
jgi:hypothetical protein